MLDTLRAWLNSNRNYLTGVALYTELGGDKDLLNVLQKGPNDFRVRRLQQDLLNICNHLKNQKNDLPYKMGNDRQGSEGHAENGNRPADTIHPRNETLYAACKTEADHAYKKVMNDRAVLFALAKEEDFTDPNMPDKVQAREKLAIDVVTCFQKVSDLYDRAAYVREHGRLPNADDESESEYNNIPDQLVKQQLDNSRKAFNKLKLKEATPARIELMQKHQVNIKKLEAKWHSLKHA